MNHDPVFSIVTPNYNYGHFLKDAIDSVASQEGCRKEHIVMDAVSTDDSLDVLRAHSHLGHLSWISEPDKGQTDAINKGFKKAKGDYVAWLNADEFYLPGTFDKVSRCFADHPEISVVYGEPLFVDKTGKPQRVKREHRFDYGVLLYYGCYIASATTFIRRKVIDDGFLLDPSFKVTMDFDYYVRLAEAGYRFGFVPAALTAFRWHDENISTVLAGQRRTDRLRVQNAHARKVFRNETLQTLFLDTAAWMYRGKRQLLKAARVLRHGVPSLSVTEGADSGP